MQHHKTTQELVDFIKEMNGNVVYAKLKAGNCRFDYTLYLSKSGVHFKDGDVLNVEDPSGEKYETRIEEFVLEYQNDFWLIDANMKDSDTQNTRTFDREYFKNNPITISYGEIDWIMKALSNLPYDVADKTSWDKLDVCVWHDVARWLSIKLEHTYRAMDNADVVLRKQLKERYDSDDES